MQHVAKYFIYILIVIRFSVPHMRIYYNNIMTSLIIISRSTLLVNKTQAAITVFIAIICLHTILECSISTYILLYIINDESAIFLQSCKILQS